MAWGGMCHEVYMFDICFYCVGECGCGVCDVVCGCGCVCMWVCDVCAYVQLYCPALTSLFTI